jgi:hypothetical protein
MDMLLMLREMELGQGVVLLTQKDIAHRQRDLQLTLRETKPKRLPTTPMQVV